MVTLSPNVPVTQDAPELVIENQLAAGSYRFQLVVIDASGLESAPAELVVTVNPPVVSPMPPPPIVTIPPVIRPIPPVVTIPPIVRPIPPLGPIGRPRPMPVLRPDIINPHTINIRQRP